MRTQDLGQYLDDYLKVGETPDYPGALNGLQVANSGEVNRIAAAVDASLETIEAAVAADADMLLVHHGLFWGGVGPITNRQYARLQPLFLNDIAVYSAHLPLDVHPEVGNNILLAKALDLDPDFSAAEDDAAVKALRDRRMENGSPYGRFGSHEGTPLGVIGRLDGPLSPEAFRLRLNDTLGQDVRLIPGGKGEILKVGIITGGAAGMIGEAIAAGCDAFVTGEGNHHSYFDAVEGGINVYFGGHYATETWGVRALAERTAEEFDLEWSFIDAPTGL